MFSKSVHKVVLIGQPRVGKTTLRRKYMGESFEEKYITTLGVEFSVKQINEKSSLHIWDLAGQVGFTSIRKRYYGGAAGALVLFDLTVPETLESLDFWFTELKTSVNREIPIFLLGNKVDLLTESYYPISSQMILKKRLEITEKFGYNVEYFQTSSLTGKNVKEVFDAMLTLLL